MMTGTDGSYHAPGLSMGQEFQELARAGLSPLKILQMAMRDRARFLRRTETMGSVAVGKNADLVLLSANPLSRVSNLTRITAVIRAGHYHSSDELAGLRRRIASGSGRLDWQSFEGRTRNRMGQDPGLVLPLGSIRPVGRG